MKRKVKFAFSFVSSVIQYFIEKREGKNVPTKTEFIKMYYKQYLELNASQNSGQGITDVILLGYRVVYKWRHAIFDNFKHTVRGFNIAEKITVKL